MRLLTISPAADVTPATELRVAVTRLARRLRQRAGSGLTPSLGAALHTVERHGPLTPSEIAAHERVQRPTATRLVAKLVERGLVERVAHPGDRRSHRVALSPAGAELLARSRHRGTEALATALEELPAADRATLARAAVLLDGLLEEEGR